VALDQDLFVVVVTQHGNVFKLSDVQDDVCRTSDDNALKLDGDERGNVFLDLGGDIIVDPGVEFIAGEPDGDDLLAFFVDADDDVSATTTVGHADRHTNDASKIPIDASRNPARRFELDPRNLVAKVKYPFKIIGCQRHRRLDRYPGLALTLADQRLRATRR
jgi:hypothetical protein